MYSVWTPYLFLLEACYLRIISQDEDSLYHRLGGQLTNQSNCVACIGLFGLDVRILAEKESFGPIRVFEFGGVRGSAKVLVVSAYS